MSPVLIVIIERRTLFRQGIAAIVRSESDFELAGEAADADEARRICLRIQPNIILLDAALPTEIDRDGLHLIASLKVSSPHSHVVILARAGDDRPESTAQSERAEAIKNGAAAYISPTLDQKEFLSILHQAALYGHPHHSHTHNTEASLTDREREVIALISEGMSNKEVAHRLGISIQTVKNHVSHLLEKLALADRTQLAIYAYENHLHL